MQKRYYIVWRRNLTVICQLDVGAATSVRLRPCFVKTPARRSKSSFALCLCFPTHATIFVPLPSSSNHFKSVCYSPNRQIRAGVPRVEWKWTARFVIYTLYLASVQNDYLFPAARQNENNFLHLSHTFTLSHSHTHPSLYPIGIITILQICLLFLYLVLFLSKPNYIDL